MSKKKYHSRKFLNKTNGMAALEINAQYTAWNFDCNVSLSDCNRRVDLDFSMWGSKNVKEKMAKLDLLINELTALKAYLEPAVVDFIKLNSSKEKDDTILSVAGAEND
jgi:hypothetical protein